MEYAKSIQWEHESYPAYEDYIVLPLFSLFFTFVRFFLDRFVFQVLYLKHLIVFFIVLFPLFCIGLVQFFAFIGLVS